MIGGVIALAVGIVGIAIGWSISSVHEWLLERRVLPPATSRQLRRAARANRLEVRTAYGEGRDLRPRARDDFDFGEEETE